MSRAGNRVGEELQNHANPSAGDAAYYVDEDGHTVLQFNAAKQLECRKLYGPAVDQILANDEVLESVTAWALADRQGSVRNVLYRWNGEIQPFEHISYETFGRPDWSGSIVHALAMDAFYAGRPYDWETAFVYLRARNLDTVSGRMASEDDIGLLSGDTNFYRSCRNSPTNYVDPSGHLAFVPLLVWGGIALTTYLARTSIETTIETTIEAGMAWYMEDETFSFKDAFRRNMAVNAATGWIPGVMESKIVGKLGLKVLGRVGEKLGVFGVKHGTQYLAETGVEVGWETVVNGRDFNDVLPEVALGNAIGHGAVRPVMHYAGRGIGAAGREILRELANPFSARPWWLSSGMHMVQPGKRRVGSRAMLTAEEVAAITEIKAQKPSGSPGYRDALGFPVRHKAPDGHLARQAQAANAIIEEHGLTSDNAVVLYNKRLKPVGDPFAVGSRFIKPDVQVFQKTLQGWRRIGLPIEIEPAGRGFALREAVYKANSGGTFEPLEY